MTFLDQLIALGISLMVVCFLFGIAGVVVEGWRRILVWLKSDRWHRSNEQWGRWRE